MANMELITSVTVGSGGAASVTLPATGTIPATYTDLKVVASLRTEGTGSPYLYLRFNGSSTSYSNRRIIGDGSAASSSAPSDAYIIGGICNTTDQTTSTFSSHDIYIPNYAGSNNKSVSVDAVTENNATSARAILLASMWANSAAITSIVFTNEAAVDFAEGSTFYLYGISNVTSTTKATGGIVSSDGTYNYHMFPFSGTFTPTEAISADVLCIAGGGGSGRNASGGGGAGGLRGLTSQSLTATAYTVTVGAGGAAGVSASPPACDGATGTNSSFAGSGFTTITASGGGGSAGAYGAGPYNAGKAGGSGAGGLGNGNSPTTAGSGNAGSYSPVEGYAGQAGSATYGGGGGGAAEIGGTDGNGQGGDGSSSYSSWAIATQTGTDNGYYAGGGGGYAPSGTNVGGLGGGGAGQNAAVGTNGVANTGGGAGGSGAGDYAGGNGGSGLVIIRYAI